MEFRYDFSDGNMNLVCMLEESIVPDSKLIQKINDSIFLLNAQVIPGRNNVILYDITGKTNYIAWREEASPKERQEMEEQITEALECCSRIGIPLSQIVNESKYMFVDDQKNFINFICIPESSRKSNSGEIEWNDPNGENDTIIPRHDTVIPNRDTVIPNDSTVIPQKEKKSPMDEFFSPAKDL